MANSPIILALDSQEVERCQELIEQTAEYVGVFKVGLEFFSANGPMGVATLKSKFPEIAIFLDLKLHDIPNTVGKASASLAQLDVEYLTVHAQGGPEMIKAAALALPDTRITAVTVLTSLDQGTLNSLGIEEPVEELASQWAKLAVNAGARAIVASPLEVRALRAALPREISLITPGIRPSATDDDQKRTMSPKDALLAGADFLVIGRPITEAKNPRSAARSIFESL
ncbi:MAG: orotidine-5'-phosphate decarboxylase [Candidatus Nanopelagicaceae bacterium]|nr:orotidine-5'-phosphate decarboxylase [Candidatus Nanopelagicaceae bacterium]